MKRSCGLMLAVCAWPLLLVFACPAIARDAAASDSDNPQSIALRTTAKVVIDEQGRPTQVEASGRLPDAIRQFVEKRVGSWTFAPPTRDGKVGGGVTFVDLGVCAIPAGDGYSLAINYRGNGPGIVGDALPTPPYPRLALKLGVEASVKVAYVVEPDGTATWEKMRARGRLTQDFEQALKAWVKTLRYVPEEFDGQRIRTRVTTPIDFNLAQGGNDPSRATGSSGCKPDDSADSIAEDSPFKRISRGD